MIALRTESSTVSIPPRERRAAKRRAKALKLGIPSLAKAKASSKKIQRQAKPLAPTLASTRERRGGELAFFNKADGFHVKRVVRRKATNTPVPQIPYLPGQEGQYRH
jgi:hypothetical protein